MIGILPARFLGAHWARGTLPTDSHELIGNALAHFNAGLNLTSTVLLVAGLVYIRRRDTRKHRRYMLGAVTASALFLVSYLARAALTGTHAFPGPDSVRLVYLVILFSHMVMAAVTAPLVVRLLYLVRHSRFRAHRRLARWTYPLWLYTSVTGLFVYFMLYHAYT